MKTFSYKARNSAGTQVQGTLDVANREAALRELRRMGLVPSQVDEAGTVPQSGSGSLGLPRTVPQSSSGSGAARGRRIGVAIAGLVLLVLAGSAWWWLGRTPPVAGTDTDSARVEQPAASNQVAVFSTGPAASRVAPPKASPPTVSAAPEAPVRASRSGESRERKRVTISLTPPVFDKEGNEIEPEPAFKTDTEIALSSILSTPPGMEPIDLSPPEPEDDEADEAAAQAEDAARALSNTIVITEQDDEQMAAHKENVGWAKADMAEAMKAGYKAREYVKALYEQIKAESKERQEFVEALEKVAQTEDKETTLAALEKVNTYLKENNRPLIDKSEIIEEEE